MDIRDDIDMTEKMNYLIGLAEIPCKSMSVGEVKEFLETLNCHQSFGKVLHPC